MLIRFFINDIIEKLSKGLSYSRVYIYLLITFFILHEWNRFLSLVEGKSIIIVWVVSVALAFIGENIFRFFFHDRNKGSFLFLIILMLSLFFSFFKDFINWISPVRLAFEYQLCLFLIIGVVVFFVVKKIRLISRKFEQFLNLLLLALVFFECSVIVINLEKKPVPNYLHPFGINGKLESRQQSSVYLVLLDEYAGSESLLRGYNYSNSSFLSGLHDLGFNTIQNASSNYKHTLFSMPSIFNGEYLDANIQDDNEGYSNALRTIYTNSTFKVFRDLGYETYNFSPFKIEGTTPFYKSQFLPSGIDLIFSSTLFWELKNSIPGVAAKILKNNSLIKLMYSRNITVNEKILNEALNVSKNRNGKPLFAYLHLNMPHAPYVLDSLGRMNSNFLSNPKSKTASKEAYLEYLMYSNKRILVFLQDLKKNTNGNAVIILMSDHGCKDFDISNRYNDRFNCLNSVYFPGNKLDGRYNSMSNVNQFRILFSKITTTSIPLLKDSVVVTMSKHE